MLVLDDDRHPVWVNETEMALLSVGLELVDSHKLFPDCWQERQKLLNRLYGLMVP